MLRADFVKSHGLGNDYLVVDAERFGIPLTPERVRLLCHRNLGPGSDGVLELSRRGKGFFARIWNPDGSEAERSGNGLRIAAKFLSEHGYTKEVVFVIETVAGPVQTQVYRQDGRVHLVRLEMGRAVIDRSVRTLALGKARLDVTVVSVGNPHCVIFTDTLDETRVKRLGPMIECHPAFPNRINVQFARRLAADAIEIMIWERGAGWTLASGTSSCGAASAAVRNGLCTHGRVSVRMPGGELAIDVRPDWSLRLEGAVELVCTGTLTTEFFESHVQRRASR
jgi:diaminopimelate epimerase